MRRRSLNTNLESGAVKRAAKIASIGSAGKDVVVVVGCTVTSVERLISKLASVVEVLPPKDSVVDGIIVVVVVR